MPLPLSERLLLTYGSVANTASRTEKQRRPATKTELAVLFAATETTAESVENPAPATLLRKPEKLSPTGEEILANRAPGRFAHTFNTDGDQPPQTTAVDQLCERFTQLLAESPLITAVTPQTQRKDKRYFSIELSEAVRKACGVVTVRAVVLTNQLATENVVRHEDAILTFSPDEDPEYSLARMYAELLAFLGLWDEWLEHTSPDSLKKGSKLHQVLSLLSVPMLETLASFTEVITTNHQRILDLLITKASAPDHILDIVSKSRATDEAVKPLKHRKKKRR
jgi:hypothetical protein